MDKETLKIIAYGIIGAVAFMVPVMLVLYGLQKYKAAGARALERILQEARGAGDGADSGPVVAIEFYTYQGFLSASYQTHHELRLPHAQAVRALKGLHRFNLIWGWWGLGGLFIPFISWWNYRAQLRNIRRQVADNQTGVPRS